ncbi:RNA-binding cell elongation regulator Jag/EloR [Salisediminibacterium halotolerans]|uniref:RNA-binding protein KhpB n=1 Tax=Salisediminibacterium halotolerans TaxID=517425 RepID=A0A1H9WN98_9BACI|nr:MULTISPECIES: RNA-binding cell elongation regulator Jag/EloR [Salisediminibacterium]RLJ69733.1 spoIIIJ-associated protein [Actinophytocola xinjiangensis]RPE89791.1 spoIIIJ-associated protein [Salisediminibacterium halotolerans]TWG32627.1 spoIIIJ-associated protein [Salisediminibacterium halotolerans]SES35167.1 spoIIIJ-associated protein [Salisediminibacterium haloalkalitolerans]GEL07561.1 DNA/RNA-binding protein [Salisediminibacterium halotolerans]
MKKVTVSGKTVDEAIQSGLEKLEAEQGNVEYDVLEEPQKAIFGLFGGKSALVEMRLKPDPQKEALLFLRDTIDKMGVQASVDQEERADGTYFNISGADIGVLIGKRGQTLDSLQYLVNLVANRYADNYIRIYLDAEGYRERRKEALETLARRISEKAVRTKREVRLEPMSSHERKVIHTVLQNIDEVSTYSEGQEPYRRIVVVPK